LYSLKKGILVPDFLKLRLNLSIVSFNDKFFNILNNDVFQNAMGRKSLSLMPYWEFTCRSQFFSR